MMACFVRIFYKIAKNPERQEFWYNLTKRTVLFNTFTGLDPAYSLPPNFVLTGPLSLPQDNLLELLGTKDPELKAWLDEALE